MDGLFFLPKVEKPSRFQHLIFLMTKSQMALKGLLQLQWVYARYCHWSYWKASPWALEYTHAWRSGNVLRITGDCCPHHLYWKASRNPLVVQGKMTKRHLLLHVYNLMTIFCTTGLPPQGMGPTLRKWSYFGHSSCSRESVLLSIISIILHRLILSMKIKHV